MSFFPFSYHHCHSSQSTLTITAFITNHQLTTKTQITQHPFILQTCDDEDGQQPATHLVLSHTSQPLTHMFDKSNKETEKLFNEFIIIEEGGERTTNMQGETFFFFILLFMALALSLLPYVWCVRFALPNSIKLSSVLRPPPPPPPPPLLVKEAPINRTK
jgi:hypothetical protein